MDSACWTFECVVTIACNDGLRFIDGLTEKTVMCQGSGSWNDTTSDCTGNTFNLEFYDI